jgi:hypothetical protein
MIFISNKITHNWGSALQINVNTYKLLIAKVILRVTKKNKITEFLKVKL